MFTTGNLSQTFAWNHDPNVKVIRNRIIVGVAGLDMIYGIINAREVQFMDKPEWDLVKERALEWIKSNPKPPVPA